MQGILVQVRAGCFLGYFLGTRSVQIAMFPDGNGGEPSLRQHDPRIVRYGGLDADTANSDSTNQPLLSTAEKGLDARIPAQEERNTADPVDGLKC